MELLQQYMEQVLGRKEGDPPQSPQHNIEIITISVDGEEYVGRSYDAITVGITAQRDSSYPYIYGNGMFDYPGPVRYTITVTTTSPITDADMVATLVIKEKRYDPIVLIEAKRKYNGICEYTFETP